MEQLFIALQRRIAEGMPELLLVDEDYGQLVTDEDTYPVVFPCVLINMSEMKCTTAAAGYQRCEIGIAITLCIDCFEDTHHSAGLTEKMAERLAMCRKLHLLLQDYIPPAGYDNLDRTSARFYTLRGGIKAYETTYSFSMDDIINEGGE